MTLLRQIEVGIANGKTTPQVCKEAEITVQTYYRWRKEYGGLKAGSSEATEGNWRRRTRSSSEWWQKLSLEKQVLKDVAEGNF